MKSLLALIMVAGGILLASNSTVHARTWTNASGQSFDGYLVDFNSDYGLARIIQQPSGKVREFSLGYFSKPDQAYIKREARSIAKLEFRSTYAPTPKEAENNEADKENRTLSSWFQRKSPPTPELSEQEKSTSQVVQTFSRNTRNKQAAIAPLPNQFNWAALGTAITSSRPAWLFAGILIAIALITAYTQASLRIFSVVDNLSTGVLTAFILVVVALTGCVVASMFGNLSSYQSLITCQASLLSIAAIFVIRILYDIPLARSIGVSACILLMMALTIGTTLVIFHEPITAALPQ